MLEPLLAQGSTGCASTLSTATSMVRLICSHIYAYDTRALKRSLDAQMHEAVAAIAKEGASPIVRIVANEAWMVKRKHFLPRAPRLVLIN